MKRKIYLVLSLVLLLTIIPMKNVVLAKENIVFPLWEDNGNANVSIYNSNNILNIETTITAKSNYNISGTIYLKKYTNGRWSQVNSWSISGTGALVVSKSYRGTSGNTYRARVSVNVEGERINSTSSTVNL